MGKKLFRKFGLLVTMLTLASLLLPASLVIAQGSVNLSLSASPPVSVSQNFTVAVQAQSGNQTSEIDVYLDFDPAYLRIASVIAGTDLSNVTQNLTDNTLGTFGFTGAPLSGPGPSGNFTVVSLTFQALKATANTTAITFHTQQPRKTMAFSGQNVVTGTLTGGNYTITSGPATKLAFTIQPGGAVAGSNLIPQPVVSVQDAQGNLVASDNTTTVTLILTGSPSGAILSGTSNVTAVSGNATFNGLKINKAGAYTLTATCNTTLTQATSVSFNITGGGGEIIISNRDTASALINRTGATITVSPNPFGAGTLTVVDNDSNDANLANVTIDIKNVPVGSYTVSQTVPPSGYFLPATVSQSGSITTSALTWSLAFANQLGALKLEARDAGTNNVLTVFGNIFVISPDPHTGTGSLTLNDNDSNDANGNYGIFDLINVLSGNYTVTQTGTPSGYFADATNPRTATVASTSLVTLTFFSVFNSGGGGNYINLQLLPSTRIAGVGNTFTVQVQAQSGFKITDGIETYIDFDPAYLAIQSATAGTALPDVLMAPFWDNTAGTFGFSTWNLTGDLPSGSITVISINFLAKKVTISPTSVTFHKTSPRKTFVDYYGTNITGVLTGASYTISPAEAPLYLDPVAVSSICGNQTFTMDIKTDLNSSQQVSRVEAYVNFDPTRLEVIDADSIQTGIQITPGPGLSSIVQNTGNNTSGLISFNASKLTAPFPTGNFTVATIQFRAKPVTANLITPITVSINGTSTTSVVEFDGVGIPGVHGDARVQIITGLVANLSVVLQGGSRPDSGWAVPITFGFFNPGADVTTATPLFAYNLTMVKSGSAGIAHITGITPGTYDITANSTTTLLNVKRNIVITAPSTDVNMGTLLEGNANGNNIVNIQDFGILAATYGKTSGTAGFDARADFDRNGIINIADFGLLASNYGKYSPINLPPDLIPKYGGILKIITGNPTNIGVPWAANTPPDLFYARPAVENLLSTDDKGNPLPWLATGWAVAPDYKSIIFSLRKGVKFHDGTDFNAAAVKYNLETNAKSSMPELKAITSVDAMDDYTVRINLSRYQPQMLSLFAVGRPGWMVSPTAAQSMTQDQMMLHPVGTGPFKFQSFIRDIGMTFTRFDNYWQTGKPYLDGIQYEIVSDPVTAMLVFKSGTAQVNYNVSPTDAYDLKNQGYNVTAAQASIYQFIPDSANPTSPWYNVNVRRAAQYAIDTVAMAKAEGFGWADPYWNQVFPKGNPAYDPTIVGYPYDPAKAKQLLASAGYPNGFSTNLYVTVPPVGDLEAAVQSYLAQVGINAQIVPLPGPSYTQANRQGWQNGLFRSQSVSTVGADPGYQMTTDLGIPPVAWFSSARPQDLQDLLNSLSTEFDAQNRAAIYKAISKNIVDTNALVISTWGAYLLAAKQPEVMGDNIRTLWTMNWTPENAWLNK